MPTRTAPRPAPPRPRMDRRIRNRRQQVARERMLRRRGVTASVLALVVLAVLALAVSRSRLFDVTEVRVSGVDGGQAQQVRTAAGVQVGEPLLRLDVAAAAGQVRRLPWVREVAVRRVPPAAVNFEVVARVPVAAVGLPTGTWLLDSDAIVVARAQERPDDRPTAPGTDGLVQIEAPNSALPVPGERASDPAVVNVMAVHRGLPAQLRDAVRRYEAPSDRDVRVLIDVRRLGRPDPRLPATLWARVGTADRIRDKAQVLSLLLDRLPQQEKTDYELDLRVPDAPVLARPAAPA